MIECTAHVPTTNGARYIEQLCKHWSHKLSVEHRAGHGVVKFEGDAMASMAASNTELVVTILANDKSTVERLGNVVAAHLDRFAFREAPLSFNWQTLHGEIDRSRSSERNPAS